MLVAAFLPLLGVPKKPEFHAISPSGKAAPPKGAVKYGGQHFAILKQTDGVGSGSDGAMSSDASIEAMCNMTTVKFSNSGMDIGALNGVLHNNLGGIGPNFGEEHIRHGPVGALYDISGDKTYIDVKISATTSYESSNGAEVNGVKNQFGIINVDYGSRTSFRFDFLLQGTNTSVTLPDFKMNLMEMSTGNDVPECAEVVGINLDANSASYILAEDTTINVVEKDDYTWFYSTEVMEEEYAKARRDDPTKGEKLSPDNVTDAMRARSMELSFSEVDHFFITLGFSKPDFDSAATSWDSAACSDGHEKSGRNFLYTFGPPRVLIPPTVEFGELENGTCTVIHNNLGGDGPDGLPGGLRYGPVGKYGGIDFDVVIQVVDGYSYTPGGDAAHINGLIKDYGIINVGYGTRTKLRFTPMYSGTNESVHLNKFEMVLYDLHTGPTVPDCAEMVGVNLHGTNSASMVLSPNPLVDIVQDGNLTWLVGSMQSDAAYRHGGCDEGCIDSISGLTADEIRRSVVLRFEEVDHFELDIAFLSPNYDTDPPTYDGAVCKENHLTSGRNILYSWGGPRWCGQSERVTMSGSEDDDWLADP